MASLEILRRRIDAALAASGLNMKSASLQAGLGETFVRDVLRRDREPSFRNLAKLADVLHVDVGWLVSEDPAAEPIPRNKDTERTSELRPAELGTSAPVAVAGRVAAGAFLEVDDFDQSEPEIFWEQVDPQFPKARRMAFDVSQDGDSMNSLKPRPILPGDRIICVAWEDVADQVKVRDGLVVVVQRTRDGGQTREWSVKQVELYEDRVEFCPRSTNPKHKPIVVKRDATADDGVQVEIIGLVRAVRNEFPL